MGTDDRDDPCGAINRGLFPNRACSLPSGHEGWHRDGPLAWPDPAPAPVPGLLEPGTYRLSRGVKNPRPDRRSTRYWPCLPEWKAGERFLVEERWIDRGKDGQDVIRLRVRRLNYQGQPVSSSVDGPYVGGRLHGQFGLHSDARDAAIWKALAPALEREAWTIGAFLVEAESDPQTFDPSDVFAMLAEQGVLTKPILERALAKLRELDKDNKHDTPNRDALRERHGLSDFLRGGAACVAPPSEGGQP